MKKAEQVQAEAIPQVQHDFGFRNYGAPHTPNKKYISHGSTSITITLT